MEAPQAACCSASASTVEKSPASSSAASFLRPVGLMRSPMTQKGWSKPMRTVLRGGFDDGAGGSCDAGPELVEAGPEDRVGEVGDGLMRAGLEELVGVRPVVMPKTCAPAARAARMPERLSSKASEREGVAPSGGHGGLVGGGVGLRRARIPRR